jgi:hypothetical protein
MASNGYMGPNEVQALIGQWVDMIGGEKGEKGERGDSDRWWRKPPPWWTGSKKDWEKFPEQQQQQLWRQGGQQGGQQGYPGGQQWPPPGYPQQTTPPAWWQSQPAWWRQQNPWFQGMPWQAQQQPYPPGGGYPGYPQQPGYPQPGYPQPGYPQPGYPQQPQQPQPSARPGWRWVPAYGSTAGHWERDRAYSPRTYRQDNRPDARPVVRDHRGSGGVTVRPREQRGTQTLTGPGLGDFFSGLFGGTGTISGQWVDLQSAVPSGELMGPHAALVEAPPASVLGRDILPLSTGVPILPTQSAQITGRPQVRAFAGRRFMVSNAGTAGGAADWIVNDIKIGNRSQFVQSGDVPGDLFAVNAIDTFVRFETAQTAMDIVIVVTYIGLNESGAPFFAAMVGTAAL